MLQSLRIATRLWIPAAALVLAMLVASGFSLEALWRSVYDGRVAQVRAVVESAVSTVAALDARAKAGEISMTEAQDQARKALRAVRFAGGEYLFAYDETGVNVAHGMRPELEGRNLWSLKDANGAPMIQDLVAAAKAGGGAVRYGWKQTEAAAPKDKIAWSAMYAPWGWAIGTGVYIDDIQADFLLRLETELGALVLVLAIAGALTIAVERSIVRPMRATIREMDEIANGNLDVAITGTGARNELGEIASALETFRDTARERAAALARERHVDAERVARAERLGELCSGFEQAMAGMAQSLTQSVSNMDTAAQTLSEAAKATDSRVVAAARAAEQAASNVHSVAAATEELFASVDEINRQTQTSGEIAHSARDRATNAEATMSALGEQTRGIGAVLDMITDIASQTNLLALNATIEAARAGEAGKGFAVVAGEVKTLANQTAQATDRIAEQIGGVQARTGGAAALIGEVSEIIGQLDAASSGISSAVEQQRAATHEIARNIHEAARVTDEMSGNVGEVQAHAAKVADSSIAIKDAAEKLGADTKALNAVVDRFLSDVRAA
jgi:methyl-accepting chemotaxis protein